MPVLFNKAGVRFCEPDAIRTGEAGSDIEALLRMNRFSLVDYLKSGVESTIEVFLEVADDFFFDAGLEQGQKKIQFRLYPDFIFTYRDHAVNSGPFKMDGIFIPPVVDTEFFSKVSCEFIRCILSVRMVHFMMGANINLRHICQFNESERSQFSRIARVKPINPYLAAALPVHTQ